MRPNGRTRVNSNSQNSEGVYLEEIDDNPARREAISTSPNILSLPVALTVSVGTVRISIEQLLALRQDSILTLDAAIDDPVDILIGERVVARGELVEGSDNPSGIGIRIISLTGNP